jgi:hypothetical protein
MRVYCTKIAPVVAAGYTGKVLINGLKTPRGMLSILNAIYSLLSKAVLESGS